MKRTVILLCFFMAVAVAATAYWFAGGLPMRAADARDASSSGRHRSETAIPVVLAQAKRMTLPIDFATIGTIQPIASIPVTAQVSGTVSRVAVADGALVKQGDVLIELDARLIDTQIAQSEATVAKDKASIVKAQRDLDRINRLLTSKFETPENAADAQTTLDLAKATLASDQAGLNNLQIQREYYTIHAPVTGRIGTVPVKPGSTIVDGAQASPIVTINVFDPVYVAVGIPQRMIADLADDKAQGVAKISLAVPGRNDQRDGPVTAIDNAANTASGLVTAYASIPNAPEALWPGEIVNVDVIFRDQADALAVPNEAIQTNQQGSYVYAVDQDQRAHVKPVTIDRSLKGMTVIASGLNAGDNVVTDGQLLLSNGTLVSIKQAMEGQ
jgi:multidrug efflux system membrane fusion protein